jgi:alkanesulfonate monooxygenase SsuD/methylene tetrahydromethanopterin reductase-like flavin-dependent oxidoreductase (luciferase family)
MCAARREMHLGVFVLGTGNHSAGWRYEGAATSNIDLSVIQEIAREAERGKFDLVFISDGLYMDPGDHPSFLCRFEPTSLISVLSASTRHIGLGATVSTTYGEPYHVARTFASIDHISSGRAAWNVVTSSRDKAALNFSREEHMEHDLRYERAEEFVDVAVRLVDQRQEIGCLGLGPELRLAVPLSRDLPHRAQHLALRSEAVDDQDGDRVGLRQRPPVQRAAVEPADLLSKSAVHLVESFREAVRHRPNFSHPLHLLRDPVLEVAAQQ